jgi:hypothetical protein
MSFVAVMFRLYDSDDNGVLDTNVILSEILLSIL